MRRHSPEAIQQSLRHLCLAWALLMFTIPALALPEDQALPIHISADQAVRNEKDGVTIYTGNVQMSQGSLKIEADKIIIYHDDKDANKIIALGQASEAATAAQYRKGPITASAETIEYYKIEERIHLTTNANIEQDGATVTGQSINYFIAEEKVMADSDTSDESDRVEVIIPSQVINEEQPESGPTEGE